MRENLRVSHMYSYIYTHVDIDIDTDIDIDIDGTPQRCTKTNAITDIDFGRSWEGESALNQDCPALPTSNQLHMTILFNSSYSQACPH